VELKKWEALLHPGCEPKLVQIRGLSNKYSPKAKMFKFLGYEPPFDRHDWDIDRCGVQVRYVIDYYTDQPAPGKVAGLYLDLRPALDSPTAAWDRLRKMMQGRQ
jgi:cytochrome c heme-lyase